MSARTRPAHTGQPNTRIGSYVNRLLRSSFVRDLTIATLIAAYLVGLCYLASFILRHPLLLVTIVVLVCSAVVWNMHQEWER